MSVAANLSPAQAQQLIYSRVRANGVPDPLAKFVVAQSGHETNGWTSDIWENANNGFGYGVDGSGAYYQYDDVEDSVDEITNWIGRRVDEGKFPNDLSTITTPDQYATLLKNAGYYGDTESNYAAGIARWFNNNLQLAAGIGVAAAVAIGLALFFILNKKP